MKKFGIGTAFFLFAVTVFAAVFTGSAHAEKRVALVIGNNNYRNVPPLRKAVNDARTMSDALKQLGFNVLFAENQTRRRRHITIRSSVITF